MSSKKTRTNENQSELQGIQKTKKIERSGVIRKDAHVSSRNKRDQAKRDEHSDSSK